VTTPTARSTARPSSGAARPAAAAEPGEPRADVFISYARADADIARNLAETPVG